MHVIEQIAHKNKNFSKSGSASELRTSFRTKLCMFFNNLKQEYLNANASILYQEKCMNQSK